VVEAILQVNAEIREELEEREALPGRVGEFDWDAAMEELEGAGRRTGVEERPLGVEGAREIVEKRNGELKKSLDKVKREGIWNVGEDDGEWLPGGMPKKEDTGKEDEPWFTG
jgi:hypothetical protein